MNEPIYSTLARLDLEGIRDHISHTLQNPGAAHRICVAIVRCAHLLVTFPHSGTLIELPESPNAVYRRVSAQHYVIIYHVKDDEVYIDRVVHESSSYFDAPLD